MIGKLASVSRPVLVYDRQVRGCGQTEIGRNIKRIAAIFVLFRGTRLGIRWNEVIRGKNNVGGSWRGKDALGLVEVWSGYFDGSHGLGVGENAFLFLGDTARAGLL